jgi:hypothetical protein
MRPFISSLNIDHRDRNLAGLLGRVPLDGQTDDLPALSSLPHWPVRAYARSACSCPYRILLQPFEQHLFGLLDIQVGDLQQLVLLLGSGWPGFWLGVVGLVLLSPDPLVIVELFFFLLSDSPVGQVSSRLLRRVPGSAIRPGWSPLRW